MAAEGPPPRLCVLTKDRQSQEYGYNLHAEKGKGQFVGTVDAGSLAEKSGLRTGDRIVAVNGASILEENHKKVVERIKSDPLKCALLVIDPKSAEWYTDRGYPLPTNPPRSDSISRSPPPAATWYAPQSKATTQSDGMKPRPRLCELKKIGPNDEFGFNLHAEKGKGHFIGTVDVGGIGDRAGLHMGQRIVGVNGELVYPNTPHKDVVALIKRSPMHTQLLVAGEDVDKWYSEHKEEYSFSFVEEREERSHPPSQSHHETLTPHVEEDAEVVTRRMTQEVIASVYEITPEITGDNHEEEEDEEKHSEISHEKPEPLSDDLLDHVFASVPITTTAVMASKPDEEQQFALNQAHHDIYSPQPAGSPESRHSSGYGHSDSSLNQNGHYQPYGGQNVVGNGAAPANDIYRLSAKEARERLRNNKRNNQRGAIDMSIEEKHRLIMNM
ncbi:unnamed protein product, partial [Mesorhabditis belari]|uniref:PDZ domain-containing protein n=1 Tax=Mesorhabditis belari TaxID=2138241 RepID=A0AAF3FMN5_9BILA